MSFIQGVKRTIGIAVGVVIVIALAFWAIVVLALPTLTWLVPAIFLLYLVVFKGIKGWRHDDPSIQRKRLIGFIVILLVLVILSQHTHIARTA